MSKFVRLGMCSCSHYACHYCYARASHPHLGLNADEDFATKIVVKTTMPEVLRQERSKPSWTRERVAIGTATDANQPCEGSYSLTHRCLEALRDHQTPVSVVTKSTLVLRDLDLLTDLLVLPGTQLNFTIITLDPTLWRLVQPGAPPPVQRLAVMRRLTDAGVDCSVYLAPLVKEHCLGFVAQSVPELLTRYEQAYLRTEVPREYRTRLEERIARIRERYGFAEDDSKVRGITRAVPTPRTSTADGRPGQLALALPGM